MAAQNAFRAGLGQAPELAMTFLLSLAASVLAKVFLLGNSAGVPPKASAGTTPPTSLCAALASVDRGQELKIVVSGVYAFGYEIEWLYDPNQLSCEADVQPRTWIEFAPKFDPTPLSKILSKDRRAYVTFEGTLFGPAPLEPDNPKLPAVMSAGDRLRGTRYGHSNLFRTQMVVTRVLEARPVPEATPWSAPQSPQDLLRSDLQLQHADLPTYPYSARMAGLEGVVEVEVTLKDGKVAATRVISGDRALAVAAVTNIETWTFDAGVNQTFTTRFVYALERRFGPLHSQKLELELDLPSSVRITAPRNGW